MLGKHCVGFQGLSMRDLLFGSTGESQDGIRLCSQLSSSVWTGDLFLPVVLTIR